MGRVDARAAGRHLPPTARSLGWGGLALASYGEGSTLQYNELIVFILGVEGWIPRAFVTHIYVDHPLSLRGGHSIWRLPKEMAEFEWAPGSASVRQGETRLVTVEWPRIATGWPIPLAIVASGAARAAKTSRPFLAFGWARATARRLRVDVNPDASFSELGFSGNRIAVGGPVVDLHVRGTF
jgi:hypothetical protein